jgi:ribosomal protein S27AE
MIEVSDKWFEESGVRWDRPCGDPVVLARPLLETTCDRCGHDEWDHDIPEPE